MKPIEFVDLKAQQRKILPELERRMKAVLQHGRYIMGPEIQELEEKLAAYVGVKHCIAVASGTDALLVALMALGSVRATRWSPLPSPLSPPEKPSPCWGRSRSSWTLTAEPIISIPRFWMRRSPQDPGHPPGQPLRPVRRIRCHQRGCGEIRPSGDRRCLPEFRATYRGRKSCALSSIGCTSFFPSKPLGCYGTAAPVSPTTMNCPRRCGGSGFTDRTVVITTRFSGSTEGWTPFRRRCCS